MNRINPHLPDPSLYGLKRRRRKYWILGVILFALYYGGILIQIWR